ncbi:MAG TPA: glycosyltransferase [Thermodesulfovibrionales bacterium]|nr:glycosyltransferase [Thermodesulfovibrionales bacterium]
MNRNKPLISILTLVYNHSAFIELTIDSVLNQTFHNWEWIILDDGSTDSTGEMIKKIKDSRIHYSLQEHMGFDHLTGTYNSALAMCGGDFIALLDGDDYWPQYKLEIQMKSFDDPNTILSYGECFVINQKGNKIDHIRLPEDLSIASNNPIGSALRKLLVDEWCFMVPPTVMLRKSVLLGIGGFKEAKGLGEDFPTWLMLSLEGGFSAIPRCLGYYRKHPFSVTATQNPIVYLGNQISFFRDFILKNNQKLENIGFSVDMDKLEKRWAKLSIKIKIIYFIRILSSPLRIDLVNLIVSAKSKLRKLMNALLKRS